MCPERNFESMESLFQSPHFLPRNCGPWKEDHAGTDFLAEGAMLAESIPEGFHPLERSRSEAVLKERQSLERAYSAEVHEGLSPVGGPPCWSRRRG